MSENQASESVVTRAEPLPPEPASPDTTPPPATNAPAELPLTPPPPPGNAPVLQKLSTPPFPRSGLPLLGILASVYEHVTAVATRMRCGGQPPGTDGPA